MITKPSELFPLEKSQQLKKRAKIASPLLVWPAIRLRWVGFPCRITAAVGGYRLLSSTRGSSKTSRHRCPRNHSRVLVGSSAKNRILGAGIGPPLIVYRGQTWWMKVPIRGSWTRIDYWSRKASAKWIGSWWWALSRGLNSPSTGENPKLYLRPCPNTLELMAFLDTVKGEW